MRLQALWSQRETARRLNVAQTHVIALETGRANPRFNIVFQILIVFSRALERSPQELWKTFYTEASCAAFDPTYQRAKEALVSERVYRGSYKSKRALRERDTTGPNPDLPQAADMRRLQHLFSETPYTLMELSEITEVSKRRLDLLFGHEPEPTTNMTLTMFTQLVAAFAPAHGASIWDTAAYLLEGDLKQLEAMV